MKIAQLSIRTYEELVKSQNFKSPNLKHAYILAWCAEIFNIAILIFDDVLDNGEMRRGIRSWHRLESIGLNAINDAFIMEQMIYALLKKHFSHLEYPKILQQSMDIFSEIGLYFQIQNDFLDCFGNIQNSGKIGTDIEDKKFSWLVVTCLELANEEQKEILVECYGSKDPHKVEKVKGLYKALDLPSIYYTYEKKSYDRTKALINNLSNGVPQEIFLDILNKIYQCVF
ncbi:farnesyl pyrophosphate synthase-like [Musca vetustissima]|uniref:farnesyl pyrophosphate synthase-like n=1 Tax=Musca vetustissima TaxID=27455 RepID=UPI002AB6D818|nr:farnesyl pyrophosphate synthase-like [Musca vetustissima]